MLFIYSLVLMLNILMTNCEQLCNCTEIYSLKEIVQKEILERKVLMEIIQREMLERKMESSKLLMKIRRLESTQRSRPNAAEIPRLDLEDQHEKMETLFEASDMKRNDLVDEKSNGNNTIVDIMKKGLMSEKQERINYISYIENQMADIKETVVSFKTETNDFIKHSVATITASQDGFEQDINATHNEMEKKAELHIENVKSELYTIEQDLLETSTKVSELNDIVLRSKFDGGWSSWGKWSSCSVSCGGGTRDRRRACTHPSPSELGRQCEGNSIMSGSCGYSRCTVDKVAFTASGIGAGEGSGDVRFPEVVENYGGDYNSITGKFTCRIPGIYHFVSTLSIRRVENRFHCFLRRNGISLIELYVRKDILDLGNTYPATAGATIHLDKGDIVNVENCEEYKNIYNDRSTIFTGFLVVADD